eukprot:gnl/TRDRNA2_/TRDRNA2_147935_c1_seq1.p1 gnl/TRDRNA2_/TRDRNA2_147935_c1~~gnl/TRDRNA2_/TRDRNA2_147935_c1_seq1.p1  ORF type:complete len:269 (+),score=57.57 gnl/TRDRNA2_/TRDRNA2_147935_c1_seq1:79-807(+)
MSDDNADNDTTMDDNFGDDNDEEEQDASDDTVHTEDRVNDTGTNANNDTNIEDVLRGMEVMYKQRHGKSPSEEVLKSWMLMLNGAILDPAGKVKGTPRLPAKRERSVEPKKNASLIQWRFELVRGDNRSGTMQRISFKLHTKLKADELGVVGWCRTTPDEAVEGVAQGNPKAMKNFRKFLAAKVKPSSSIDSSVFMDERQITQLQFSTFAVTDDPLFDGNLPPVLHLAHDLALECCNACERL